MEPTEAECDKYAATFGCGALIGDICPELGEHRRRLDVEPNVAMGCRTACRDTCELTTWDPTVAECEWWTTRRVPGHPSDGWWNDDGFGNFVEKDGCANVYGDICEEGGATGASVTLGEGCGPQACTNACASAGVCTGVACMKIHSPTSVDELKDLFGTGATQAEKEAIGCCIDTSGIAGMLDRLFAGGIIANSYNENDPLCWDVSKITDFTAFCAGCATFNGDVSTWDTSRVTVFEAMFASAYGFNGDISKWDVSKANDFNAMLGGGKNFNRDLNWDVANAINLVNFLQGATIFNGDISKWDTAKATNFRFMFEDATSFAGDLSAWDVDAAVAASDFSSFTNWFLKDMLSNTAHLDAPPTVGASCWTDDPYYDRAWLTDTCAYNTGCLEEGYCEKTGRMLAESIVVPINNDEFD